MHGAVGVARDLAEIVARECDAGLPGRGLRTDLGLLGMRPGVDRARENLTTRKTETVPSLRYLDGRLETLDEVALEKKDPKLWDKVQAYFVAGKAANPPR